MTGPKAEHTVPAVVPAQPGPPEHAGAPTRPGSPGGAAEQASASTRPGLPGGAAEQVRAPDRPPGGVPEEDDTPLPELPPLPADPRWRIEHLPMVTAAGVAVVLGAASAGFLAGGPVAALGAAAGVLVVLVSLTMSTLVIAWADTVRPALVLPVGVLTYVIKFTLISVIMISVMVNGWSGARPMAWGIAGGAVLLTAVQVWWVSRLARRDAPYGRPAEG